ncbi:MAG: TetR/AcrR family transcriptional regulator [Eubacteriales bacterium]
MKKQPNITTQTRQNLIDAFWSLYCEKRIEKVTVKEISVKAGYSRGTFYEYFNDVYDVLSQIENALIPDIDLLPLFNTANESTGIPLETMMKIYAENSRYYTVLLGENGDPVFAVKLKKVVKPMLAKAFRTKINADESEFDYIIEFYLSAMIGIMSYWYKRGESSSLEELLNLIREITEHGISARFIQSYTTG